MLHYLGNKEFFCLNNLSVVLLIIHKNNGSTLIYKTELNLENKQEKSRPNSNEFKRLSYVEMLKFCTHLDYY